MTLPPRGHIKLARKLFADHPFWTEKRTFSRFEAWVDCIQLAQYKPYVHVTSEGAVALQRGEFVASLRWLAGRWGWSVKKVRGFATIAQRTGLFRAQRTAHAGTVYLIVNYDVYQGEGTPEGTDKGTARAQQGHKNKQEEASKQLKASPNDGDAPPKPAKKKGEPAPWMGLMSKAWTLGDLPLGSATHLRQVVAKLGPEETALRMANYCQRADPDFASLKQFIAKHATYADAPGKPVVDPETGLLNEAGMLAAFGKRAA